MSEAEQAAVIGWGCEKQRGPCEFRVGIVTTHPEGFPPGYNGGHYAVTCCGSDRCIERHRRSARRIARMDASFVDDRTRKGGAA